MTFKEKRNKEWKIFVNQGKEAVKELFSKKWYRQIPNLLTFSRLLAPFVVIPLLCVGNIFGALIAEGIFALTDTFDGLIARRFNLVSDFGKRLDTICDKIFAITLLVPIYTIMPTISISIGLEVLIAVINSISTIKGNNPASSSLGKCKTFFLSGSILLGYLSMVSKVPLQTTSFAFAVTSILQAGAVMDYYITDKIKDVEKERKELDKKDDDIKEDDDIKKDKEVKKEKEEEKVIQYHNDFPPEDLTKQKRKRLK